MAVEGRIAFHGYETWYRIEGEAEEPGKLPVLCLHGGPGATWHHMEPYAALADGRRVVLSSRRSKRRGPYLMWRCPSTDR